MSQDVVDCSASDACRSAGFSSRGEVAREGGQLVGSGGVEDHEVDRPVAVDDPVSQPARLLPDYVRELLFEVVENVDVAIRAAGLTGNDTTRRPAKDAEGYCGRDFARIRWPP